MPKHSTNISPSRNGSSLLVGKIVRELHETVECDALTWSPLAWIFREHALQLAGQADAQEAVRDVRTSIIQLAAGTDFTAHQLSISDRLIAGDAAVVCVLVPVCFAVRTDLPICFHDRGANDTVRFCIFDAIRFAL